MYALFATGVPLELHIGSEYALESEIQQAMRLAEETLGDDAAKTIHFHGIKGDSQFQAMTRPVTGIMNAWQLPLPNFSNAAKFMTQFSYVRMPQVCHRGDRKTCVSKKKRKKILLRMSMSD